MVGTVVPRRSWAGRADQVDLARRGPPGCGRARR